MNEQEKTKKLEMLPWQALFDLAISKEIDENDIKGKEKSTIIFKIIHEAYTVLVVPHSTYNVLKGIVLVEWKTGTFLQAGCIL